MLKELLKQLYLNLENEIENDRKNKTGNFDFFEERILKQERFSKYKNVSVTPKTMKNYYEKHVEGRKNKSKEPTIDLKNLIAEYLNYKNYADFVSNFTPAKFSKGKITKSVKYSPLKLYRKLSYEITVSYSILFMTIFSLFIYKNNYTTNNNCILLHDVYYEKSPCPIKVPINNHAINITVLKKETAEKNASFF
ncbi:hypothetical protein [uncultured Tenacibaculum sp.]|uniref:hypothetical protein n=1 Tax=uncultured Tenacibaculum sp. TaxID=174713 RepID=UPI0026204CA4|nr:hypothetical protein [uncultured Tenacibaculum sp.]